MKKIIVLFVNIAFLNACSNRLSQLTSVDNNLATHQVVDRQATSLIEGNTFSFYDVEVPVEVMLQIFSQLSVKDIVQAGQVCKAWYQLSEDAALWREVCLHIHGDYPVTGATKEQAKLHLLRVHVNTLTDLTKAQSLINKYQLNKCHPFICYQDLITVLIDNWSQDMIEERATQGSQLAIERKMRNLFKGKHGYQKDPKAAAACNEYLIELGNKMAVERKINGLVKGEHGYKKDAKAAMVYNENLIEQGDEAAIERKVKGLINGFYGYKKEYQGAISFNENLIKQGNEKAIAIKILGLSHENYGYKSLSKKSILVWNRHI